MCCVSIFFSNDATPYNIFSLHQKSLCDICVIQTNLFKQINIVCSTNPRRSNWTFTRITSVFFHHHDCTHMTAKLIPGLPEIVRGTGPSRWRLMLDLFMGNKPCSIWRIVTSTRLEQHYHGRSISLAKNCTSTTIKQSNNINLLAKAIHQN